MLDSGDTIAAVASTATSSSTQERRDRYPALYVRIQHRFGPRILEWFISFVMVQWGVVLLLPFDSMESPAWAFMRSVASEESWGLFFTLTGMIRLSGLIVNGSLPRVTPHIRIYAAMFGFMVWTGVSYSFAVSGVFSTWIAVYPSFAFAELINIYRASLDGGGTRSGRAL